MHYSGDLIFSDFAVRQEVVCELVKRNQYPIVQRYFACDIDYGLNSRSRSEALL